MDDFGCFKSLASKAKNVFYANNVGKREEVDSVVSLTDLEMVLFFLKTMGAKKFGIRNDRFYPMISHTDLKADFEMIKGFKPVYRYKESENPCNENEYGQILDFRLFCSPQYKPYYLEGAKSNILLSRGMESSSKDNFYKTHILPKEKVKCDVYPIIFVGDKSYGIERDSANRRNKWTEMYAEILNQNHIAVLEVGCSTYPGYDELYN